MGKTTKNSEKNFFSGQLHPGVWVLGISLLTMNIYRVLRSVGVRSLFIPFVVGGALGSCLCIYALVHRRQMRELHQAGAQIRKSEAKYRTFFENSVDAMLVIEDGKFVDCNAAAVAMLGYDHKEAVIHLPPSDLSPDRQPDGRSSVEKADEMMRWAKKQGSHRFEWDHIRKDGTMVPVEVSLTAILGDGVLRFHTVWRDITKRKYAEESLRESEEKFRGLVEASSDWIWEVNDSYVYTYCSPQVEQILGYTPEEVIGKAPSTLMAPEEETRLRKLFSEKVKKGLPLVAIENVNLHKEGREVVLETSGVPVFDEEGKRVGYRGVDRDITHRVQAGKAHEELEVQLRQAQKMEAVGQMAGGIAHDFNNLLQIIGGYAELSQVDMDPESALGASLKHIDKAAQRGKTLVRQLLAFSRRQIIDPVDLNLNGVFEPLLHMIRGLIGEHIKLKMVLEESLATVHVDRSLVEQVLVNLCVNARDAMSGGGTLTIETENILFDSEYAQTHSWATEGCYVLLSVSDTGCGMEEETLERVFEPFFTTKEVGKGTGLGLSMAYGIIEQHKGHISVHSERSQGSCFKIYLPAVKHRTVEVSSEVPQPVTGGTETLLVAEDDESVLRLSENTLRSAGYTVLTAKDGRDAVQVFEKHANEIDLVMMDVVMPRMGGKEAMKHILKKNPDLPYLFASGYSEDAVHTDFIQNRGLHLLRKPYQTHAILRKIREVLDGK